MNPRLRRIVDGVSITGDELEEEKMDEGDNDEAGGARDSGWIRSQPGTPSSTRGPRRMGGDRIVPLSRTRRNAKSGRASRLRGGQLGRGNTSGRLRNDRRCLETIPHLIDGGRIIGSRFMFRSTSSIKPTFHRSRCICHQPRPNVKIGTQISTSVVGRRSWSRNVSCRDEYPAEEEEGEAEA